MNKRSVVLKSISNFLKQRYHILIIPIFLVIIIEAINRGSFSDTIIWAYTNINELFLNYVIFTSVFLIVSCAINRLYLSYLIVSILLIVIATINGVKFRVLGLPLLPWDFILAGESLEMVKYFIDFILSGFYIVTIMIFIIIIVAIKFLPQIKKKYKLYERISLGILAVLALLILYLDKPIEYKKVFNIEHIRFDQSKNYLKNGFLLSFMMNANQATVMEPSEYSEQSIMSMVDEIERRHNIDTDFKPNIIIILSESFWDPTVLENISFSQDPLPFFHSLQEKHISGSLFSPSYGGATSNVEFEILTGHSMRFLPQGSTPYLQYINSGVESLASILRRQGYHASAIGAYYNWFYDNNKVYKRFGFSNFISSEVFKDPVMKGLYIADDEVANVIIETTELSEGPDFIFASTMQNHGPYDPERFDENLIQVSGNISKESQSLLETYAQGAYDADKFLEKLVNYYDNKDEPTIIVFFGDHLPALNTDYGIYKETGYISGNGNSFTDYKALHTTPLLIWNNFLSEKKETLHMSPSFLGAFILDLAQKEGTVYTDFLYNQFIKTPIIPPNIYYSEYNINEDDLLAYNLLQYDYLFGKQYLVNSKNEDIIDTNFKYGNKETIIDEIVPNDLKSGEVRDPKLNGTIIAVNGKNFYKDSIVFVNGKPLDTTYGDEGFLTAILPAKYNAKVGKLNFQIKLFDSKGKVLVQSNIYDMDVSSE
ncbi:LTA synthase family protein [Paenibacillus sp. J2TS4]|uniref:LTA synthase family protein n=1 Tax=Paenibacillus sp. J2TS4 TaxID=2807194 RepID=UPI001B2BF1CC|nr:LTA synthase family protein [Paenibacillus sp. J2TS4]GIP35116.1 phosphoglycerol transferase [Paenibacillus sp. J2TS4]